jgi:methyl-accepting chemotaxis protein
MDLNSAVQKHAEWKTKLRSAIARQEQMDIVTLSRDDCCELGEWLHGDGRARFGRLDAHADCLLKHKAFHTEVSKVATAVNAKRYAYAEGLLGAATPYAKASSALSVAFLHLRKATDHA